MKKVASVRRCFGYRRIHVMLDRQGIVMNLKKLRRLNREEKQTVRKRGGRKRALGTRRPLALPSRPDERWSLDFVSDEPRRVCRRPFRLSYAAKAGASSLT
jgi:putative transposase